MAVKIRLTRKGKRHQPTYRVVVADSRRARDGRFIEQIGRYDPRQEPSLVEIDTERAAYWLANGAQPSDQVRKLLEIAGALEARPARDRKIHVVGEEAQIRASAEVAAIEVVEDVESGVPAEEPAAEPVAEVEAETVEPMAEVVEDVDESGVAAEEPAAEPVAEVEAETVELVAEVVEDVDESGVAAEEPAAEPVAEVEAETVESDEERQ